MAAAAADNLNTVGVPMYLAKLVMAVVVYPSFIAKVVGATGNNLVKGELALTSEVQPEVFTD